MLFSSWLRNGRRSAPAARQRSQTSPRQRASFRPQLETLEDRLTPSTGYVQTSLVSYQPGLAHFTDSNLNGWGMTSMPNGTFVVANAFSDGTATSYTHSGKELPLTINVPVEAAVSGVLGISTQYGHPTGVVYNPTNNFWIKNPETGASAPATLIFDTLDGIICGWNPVVDATHAIVLYDALADSGAPAVYTSLEIGQNVLYATDFLHNQLDIIGTGQAQDDTLTNINPIPCAGLGVSHNLNSSVTTDPNSWVWSVSAVNNILIVTFADLFGPVRGGGAVDVFNTDGGFLYQIDANDATSNTAADATGRLENPWGVTLAPGNFGTYGNDLLVGNVWGHGNIDAYQPDSNGNDKIYAGQLAQPDGTAIAIKGLWDMEFDDGPHLFFDAGPNKPGDATGGLFGVIQAADRDGNGGGAGSASIKPSSQGHGGGSGGAGASFYPTAATVSQLIADINYANKAGGTITINLQPNTTFDLNQINNTTYSYYNANALPIIGGTKAVDLTILGNGDTIAWAGGSTYSNVQVRLVEVAQLGSLTLDDVTLQNGSSAAGGAIYNQGTLNVIDHSTLSGNSASDGGGIYNAGGTVAISDSVLSGNSALLGGGIYIDGGTVTVSNSTLSLNYIEYIPPGYGISGGLGGAIYVNAGTLTVSDSVFSNNSPDDIYGPYTDGGGNTGLS
jgi:uncharacterized protein (TIGR03118 family)